MAWWDTIFDVIKTGASAAKDFAVANPGTAGAIASGLTGGFQGKYGSNNLGNIAGGYLAGTALSGVANSMGSPASETGRLNTPMPSAASATSSFNPGVAASTVTPAASAATGSFGSMGSSSYFGGGYDGARFAGLGAGAAPSQLESVFSKAKSALGNVRQFGADNQDVLRLGGKAVSAYLGSQESDKVAGLQRDYAAQRSAADAENRAIVGKKNALADEVTATTMSTMDPQNQAQRAWASTQAATKRGIGRNNASGMSTSAKAAENRRAMLTGSTAGVSNATQAYDTASAGRRAGLQTAAGMYTGNATPTYDGAYEQAVRNNGAGTTSGAYGLLDDVFDLSKDKADKQVGA
jgi:hypothetical protein